MPGMGGSPIQLNNPLVVAMFRHSLLVTSVYWILGLGLVILLASMFTRRIYGFNLSEAAQDEPRSRTYLRWGFGALWLIDGVLQFQPSMPLGLANFVVAPAADGTPHWLHALVFDGIGVWNSHPVALAVGTAWIQVGIGLVLIVSNGVVGRGAAAISAGWAAMIWLIGNGAGGIFSSSSSILFGWPGATSFYVAAGLWLALDTGRFARHFSRVSTRGLALVLLAGAVVQCLPGREFWHGGNSNALTTMTRQMTQTPQPHWLAWITNEGGTVAGTLGGGFNVIVVLWLLICATGMWFSCARQWRWPVVSLVVGCLVFWIIGEDAAIFGGLATDVNSLPPLALLAWSASPRLAVAPPRPKRMPPEMRSSSGAVAAIFASAAIVFSVVSMGWASFAGAENTFFLARNGSASQVNSSAPGFTLTDQFGSPYTLGEHRGHYTLLTFLDPVCWTDCPLLANQLRSVRSSLSPTAPLDIVAVAADPYHETLANVKHFIAKRHLSSVKNFYFVTSTNLATEQRVWAHYGISVIMKRTDKMSIHSDFMFIIDPRGRLTWIVPDDPLSSWSGERSAVSELLSLLHQSGLQ